MKIVIADLFSPEGVEELKKMGEVTYIPKKVGKEFEQEMATVQPEILIVRSKKVTKDVINADPKLVAVIRAGAGYDTIDVAYCSSKGITVSNCPGKNNIAVAELAMGLILSLDRRIPENVQLLKEGKWNKEAYAECSGLFGRTLGLIGTGFVGSEVAKRAIAFGMKVIAYDIFISKEDMEKKGMVKVDVLEDLIKKADVISMHVPLLKETAGMINAKFMSMMKDDAVIINTARGELAVEADVIARLNAKPLFYYGCDVICNEPSFKKGEFKSELAMHSKCYATHHIGASTKQAEEAIGIEAVRMVKKYSETKVMDNVVNAKDIKKP
jgi:D-3-phosphoglycerate dehydrogenase